MAFQDLIPDNLCFGCGVQNDAGLKIRSFWDGEESICTYHPSPHHSAGPRSYVNGGILATLIDCHSVCTAIAGEYRREGRPIGSDPAIWYATRRLEVEYRRPTPIDQPIELRARIDEVEGTRTTLRCTVRSGGKVRAEALVVAVRVPDGWRRD